MGSRAVCVFVRVLMIVCAAIARRESNGRGGADARVAADEAAIAREWRNALDPLRHDFTGARGGYGRIVRHFEDVVAAHEPAASWRGERVVDIGCGGGWLGVWALMRGALHYVGVDARMSLATSRRKLTDAGFAEGTQYELLGAAKAREAGYKGADVVVAPGHAALPEPHLYRGMAARSRRDGRPAPRRQLRLRSLRRCRLS